MAWDLLTTHYSRIMFARLFVVVLQAALVGAAWGGEAAPAADDPVLEKRVHELSAELRCLVCQNEALSASRAPLAVDLRNQIRERMRAGESDDQIVAYLVSRYGDFVLYRPPFKATTLLLWLGPLALLVIGFGLLSRRLARRSKMATAELSDADRERARALLSADRGERP